MFLDFTQDDATNFGFAPFGKFVAFACWSDKRIYLVSCRQRMDTSPSALSENVFGLFRKHGNEDYLGEKVTQLEHAVQCAMMAEKESSTTEVICLRKGQGRTGPAPPPPSDQFSPQHFCYRPNMCQNCNRLPRAQVIG